MLYISLLMYIRRQLQDALQNDVMHSGKLIMLYGPRQAGKTTLSKAVIASTGLKTMQVNADQLKFIDILSSRDLTKLKALVDGYECLFIDEGQRVPDIGINLKILHDELPGLKVLVTGSSSFLLSNSVTEALTGRKKIYTLLPVSTAELSHKHSVFELNDMLENRMVFGSYPEVLTSVNHNDKIELLNEITQAYIYKDIVELESIRYPVKLRQILKLLALQAGSQVSIHELCRHVGLNRETVERYLFLLEQAFIVFRLPAFSRNPRNEISKSQKFCFFDNGILNSLTENFNSLSNRKDVGMIWENFIISERVKKQYNERMPTNNYFWRTYSGNELDFIEESQGNLRSFEIKFGKPRSKPPKAWTDLYTGTYDCITPDNYLEFI